MLNKYKSIGGESMSNNHDHKKHGLWMIICCLVPMVLLALLFSLNLQNSVVKAVAGGLLILVCPLAHILMMVFMKNEHNNNKHNEGQNKDCH